MSTRFSAPHARTKIVFLANPNNPTGTYLPFERNQMPPSAFAEAASFFDIQDQAIACRVQTEDELEDALASVRDREALVLIELVMSRLDAPKPLVNFAQRCAEFNFPTRDTSRARPLRLLRWQSYRDGQGTSLACEPMAWHGSNS
jgi:hypothetical protein